MNAVCVDVLDHGMQETPWGVKPRLDLVFETDGEDEFGNPKIISRTFNNFAFSKSALTAEIKSWLGLDISGDDKGWDVKGCVGRQARLTTTETVSRNGNAYTKIEAITPPGAVHVQPSGIYLRKKSN